MNYLKIAALTVCALVLAIILSGSESLSVPDGGSNPSGNAGSGTAGFSGSGIDMLGAMKTFAPGTVMARAGELTVTWGELYFLLFDTVAQLTNGFSEAFDWDEPAPEGDGDWGGLLRSYIIDQASQSLVYKYGIELYGVSLDEITMEQLVSMIDSRIEEASSLESLEEELYAGGIYGLEVFEILLKNFFLQDLLPAALYGNTYDVFPDDAVEEFAQRQGFMRAKHILLSFLSEYDGYTEQEIEDAKQEAYDKMLGILEELAAYEPGAELNSRFDELIVEYSEDPGSFSYPDGYLFQHRDMVAPFSDACEQLEYGHVSGIVETSYGYHILLRLPLDYDNMIPVSFANAGQYYSLRQLAVFEDYDDKFFEWFDSMDIVNSPELETLDINRLFRWVNAD